MIAVQCGKPIAFERLLRRKADPFKKIPSSWNYKLEWDSVVRMVSRHDLNHFIAILQSVDHVNPHLLEEQLAQGQADRNQNGKHKYLARPWKEYFKLSVLFGTVEHIKDDSPEKRFFELMKQKQPIEPIQSYKSLLQGVPFNANAVKKFENYGRRQTTDVSCQNWTRKYVLCWLLQLLILF